MPQIQCPIRGRNYTTDDVDPAVAAALLIVRNNVHSVATGTALAPVKHRAPTIPRANIEKGSREETWYSFLA